MFNKSNLLFSFYHNNILALLIYKTKKIQLCIVLKVSCGNHQP